MKSYSDVKAQIEQLEQEAEALRQAEIAEAVARIHETMKLYSLTVEDLGLKAGKGKGKALKTVGAPKYRDPKTGATWTGRGKPPNWIAKAKNRDSFLIEAAGAEAKAAVEKAKSTKAPVKAAKVVKAAKPAATRSKKAEEAAAA